MKTGDAAAIQSADVFVEPTWILDILRKAAFLKNFAFKCNETLSEKTLWLTLHCVKILSKSVKVIKSY